LYHFKSLRSRFAEFHAEFDVRSLLQFHVHVEIANVTTNVVTLMLCNSQCSYSNATQHAEWWRSLLPSTAHSFMYCHQLAVYGTSLKTFWYTLVQA
jgi:hypothetical protein